MTPAWRPGLIVLVLLAPALAGCVSNPLSGSKFLVVVSTPREGGGMTIFAVNNGILPGSGSAEFEIRYGEETVYPAFGRGAVFDVDKDGGTVFVPYALFVVGNGDYEVRVRYDGVEVKTRATITKWVNYVYLHPFDRGSKVVVDAQLSRTTGGFPTDRILTEGELILEIHYRGQDGKRDVPLGPPIKVATSQHETFTRVEIPRSRFSEGPGYYSVDPVFHNQQAKGNLWVPADPTMKARNPPWNWIYMSR